MPKISAATVAEHRVRTRDLLLDAMDALVAERPFESISMREIAAMAGVNRTAIYNYAPDTISLLAEAVRRGSAEVREAVASRAADTSMPPSGRLRAIVTDLLLDHTRTTRTFLAAEASVRALGPDRFDRAVEPFRAEIGGIVMDVVRAGVADGEFAPVTDPPLTLALMVGVMQTAILRVGDSRTENLDVANAAARFLVNALSGPAA